MPVSKLVIAWKLGAALAAGLFATSLSAMAETAPDLPRWTPLARTAASVPLGTVVLGTAVSLARAPRENTVALDRVGYVEEEYLVSGRARMDATGGNPARRQPYTTRVLVRRPSDPGRFSGTVHLEPFDGGEEATIWRWAWPTMVANGDVWVGFTASKASVSGLLKPFDLARYATLDIPDDRARMNIMADVAALLRNDEGPLGKLGFLKQASTLQGLVKIYVSGWGETGCMASSFVKDGGHERARTDSGQALINGYLIGACPGEAPITAPPDAAVVEILTETAFQGSPQAVEAIVKARAPDGDLPGKNRFRWYEIAGASDAIAADQPQFSIVDFQLGRHAANKCVKPVSDLPGARDFVRGILSSLDRWVRTGIYAPPGKQFALEPGYGIKRDAYGNATGGVRPYWIEEPRTTFAAKTDGVAPLCSRLAHEEPLASDTTAKLYKDDDDYVEKVAEHLDALVTDGFLLFADAKTELGQAKKVILPRRGAS
ncbi:MAG TPA: alpha/beta hydrolase domain-containing protein [Alphaproteobacteria bacterium]|nr:alpha/beta hydrolase domain-containing protein [Alphaproteobacteria bacterium]